jgi:hypothetical protein
MNDTKSSLCCKLAYEIKCEAENFRIKGVELRTICCLLQMLCRVMDTGVSFVCGKGAVLGCTVKYDVYTYNIQFQ